jgi:hypothetical protein
MSWVYQPLVPATAQIQSGGAPAGAPNVIPEALTLAPLANLGSGLGGDD